MDLLGDLGTMDQLTSVRAENAVLQDKVKELSMRVRELTIESESLRAEVEMYRNEVALPNFSQLKLGNNDSAANTLTINDQNDAFLREGNGVFTRTIVKTLTNLHGPANSLSCCLSPDDTILATGGADRQVNLTAWNTYSADNNTTSQKYSCAVSCAAPVIATRFAPKLNHQLLAAGCMDGSVNLWSFENSYNEGLQATSVCNQDSSPMEKHAKFCKNVVWSPDASLLATAAADGSVHLYKINRKGFDWNVSKYTSLHFDSAVEALCFSDQHLIGYCRGTPHLMYFDLGKDLQPTKVHLNAGKVNGGFDDHVSYCVMDMHQYDNKYLAAATDSSRNIVLDIKSGHHIRDLYGHANDSYANPKVAWSANGQYLLGNTQDSGALCVWDIASSKLIEQLPGHNSTLRDLYSSMYSDTVVTTAFDRETRVWINDIDSMET